ncbi:MAG: glycosyltransferase, partial [Tumebacillaceae bacterium]
MIAVDQTPKRKLLFITRDFSRNVDPLSHYFALALAKHCHLMLWHAPGSIHEIVAQLPERPEFILLNDMKDDYCPAIYGLAELSIPFGSLLHDLHWGTDWRRQFIRDNGVRHLFTHYRDKCFEWFPEFADRVRWLPHFVNPDVFRDYGQRKEIDWLMMGALDTWAYPLRRKMWETMKGRSGFVYHPHPGYRDVTEAERKHLLIGENYAREINRAKLFLTCDSVFHYPLIKYYEVLACKTLLLAPASQELRDLGFLPGVHFVAINEEDF